MTDKTYKIIEELAEKLNTSTDVLWVALLRQSRIEFYANIIIYLLALALLAFCVWLCVKKAEDDNVMIPLGLFTLFLGLAVFIGIPCTFTNTIAAGFNPEYWALTQIIK